jgi:diacylglycerol kinase (ATP)
MTNYFGIGLDAYVTMGFHEKREKNPEKFTSRMGNKAEYFKLGLKATASNPCRNLGKYVTMRGDGEEIDVSKYDGIVVCEMCGLMPVRCPCPLGRLCRMARSFC